MQKLPLLVLVLSVAACGGEKPSAETANSAVDPTGNSNPDEFRKAQQRYADSLLNTASSSKQVAERLGKGYEVGSTRLRDSVALLSDKSDCISEGRKLDPYLSGSVSFWVNMNVIGSDLVRVSESKWTSPAGPRVEACLNEKAKGWKFDPSFGKPMAYVVTVQFRTAADSTKK